VPEFDIDKFNASLITICSKDEDRRSTLMVEAGKLYVMGNLPHGYRFEPSSTADAEKLIKYLEEWIRSNGN